MLTACATAQRADVASRLIEEMQSIGLKPDVYTYTTLIKVYGKCRLIEKAMEVLTTMQAAEVEPNIHTYGCVIYHCCEDGQVERALKVLRTVQTRNQERDLSGTELESRLGDSYVNFRHLDKQVDAVARCIPNTNVYNNLIFGYGGQGEFHMQLVSRSKVPATPQAS